MAQKKQMGYNAGELKEVESWLQQYAADTGDDKLDWDAIAAWLIENKMWTRGKVSAIQTLSAILRRCATQITFKDEDGNNIRKYHAYRAGHDQPALWDCIDTISRENMNSAKTLRRNKLLGGVVRLQTDLDYFNKHRNPGDPLEFDPDFGNDLRDRAQPSEYKDQEPEE